jgi:hypothetical protein
VEKIKQIHQSKRNKMATEYTEGTVHIDKTGDDEALVQNLRFMAFCAGWDAALDHNCSSKEERNGMD